MTYAELGLNPQERNALSRLRKAANNLAHAIRLGKGPPRWSNHPDGYGTCAGCGIEGVRIFRRHFHERDPLRPAISYLSHTRGGYCVRCVVEDLAKRGMVVVS